MTTLHSLEIQGIRCFSPTNPQSIRFEKPLTLIVGQNGAGKTTIVECLKMATSGILPPNADRGKSFIHDSKLANNGDVRAHIKLTVETYNKDTVSATRKFTIARDRNVANKVTFKTGETVLNIKSYAGEESTVSMKCSEMDNSVPSLMGLSRALIDSVIFCHQDENNWVLDDLAAVKARFDDLLETSRYTKALGALAKAKKEQEEAIKLTQTKLEYAKCQIIQMADLRNQLSTNMKDMESTKETISMIESEVNELSEASKEYKTQLEQVSKLAADIRDTKAIVDRLVEEEKKLMEPMEYLYEEGLHEMRSYAVDVSSQLEVIEANASEVAKEIERLMDSMNEMHQVVALNTDKANNRIILKESAKSIRETLEVLKKDIIGKLDIDEAEFSDAALTDYMEQSSCTMDEDATITNELNECKAKIAELEKVMQDLNTERSGKDFLLQTLGKDIYDTTAQRKSLGDVEGSIRNLETRKEERNKSLEKAQSELQQSINESNDLKAVLKKLRNSIDDACLGNKEELSASIKFLESILVNDRQVILQYVKDTMNEKINENDYIGVIQKYFQKWLETGKSGRKRKTATNFHKTQQFQEDCASAVIQMIQHSGGMSVTLTNNAKDEAIKPYNILAKVATNTRIAEYIEYFKTLLKEEKAKMYSDASYEEVFEKLDSLKRTIAKKEDEIAGHEMNLEELDKELSQIVAKKDRRDEYNARLSEMEARKDQYLADMNFVEESLEKTKEELRAMRERYDELNVQIMSANKTNAFKTATIASLIDRYMENVEKMERTEKELLATNEEGDKIEEIKERINETAEEIKKKRAEHKELMESIDDHRKLLESVRKDMELKEKQKELTETRNGLMSLMEEMGDRNEEEIASKVNNTNERCAKAGLEIATLKGTLLTREENITRLQNLLESDNYKYVQKTYIDTLIKLKTHKIAKTDLELYGKTMEMALHKFHSEKIVQINSVLKRVWREVYTGSHIDYIEIKSTVDTTVPITSQAPKSYNYRLVMVTQNGTEMDMRGHCSAGERVLASLIIRITLTETFCTKCNILTLDEPTTNLDRENTSSLEDSLAKLVNECSVDFQLVIITHDEPFARKMSQRCNCDMYYKITKNERNESIINAVPLSASFMS